MNRFIILNLITFVHKLDLAQYEVKTLISHDLRFLQAQNRSQVINNIFYKQLTRISYGLLSIIKENTPQYNRQPHGLDDYIERYYL